LWLSIFKNSPPCAVVLRHREEPGVGISIKFRAG
jgi:hypothetical protein